MPWWEEVLRFLYGAIKESKQLQLVIGLSALVITLILGLRRLRLRDVKEELTAILYAFMTAQPKVPTSKDMTKGYEYYNTLTHEVRIRYEESKKEIKNLKQQTKKAKKNRRAIKRKLKK